MTRQAQAGQHLSAMVGRRASQRSSLHARSTPSPLTPVQGVWAVWELSPGSCAYGEACAPLLHIPAFLVLPVASRLSRPWSLCIIQPSCTNLTRTARRYSTAVKACTSPVRYCNEQSITCHHGLVSKPSLPVTILRAPREQESRGAQKRGLSCFLMGLTF